MIAASKIATQSPPWSRPRAGDAAAARRAGGRLAPAGIALDVDAVGGEGIVRAAARLAAAHCPALDVERTFRALWRREQAGSTALGAGVAIPHARVQGVERPTLFYVRPRYAIDFRAPDGKPAAHFLVIVVPPNGDVDEHLELLARASQLFSEGGFRQGLALAGNADDVRKAFDDALALIG
jgi:PTS system nitrogen regulatory IIA component